jgi:hypothetical protein
VDELFNATSQEAIINEKHPSGSEAGGSHRPPTVVRSNYVTKISKPPFLKIDKPFGPDIAFDLPGGAYENRYKINAGCCRFGFWPVSKTRELSCPLEQT